MFGISLSRRPTFISGLSIGDNNDNLLTVFGSQYLVFLYRQVRNKDFRNTLYSRVHILQLQPCPGLDFWKLFITSNVFTCVVRLSVRRITQLNTATKYGCRLPLMYHSQIPASNWYFTNAILKFWWLYRPLQAILISAWPQWVALATYFIRWPGDQNHRCPCQ